MCRALGFLVAVGVWVGRMSEGVTVTAVAGGGGGGGGEPGCSVASARLYSADADGSGRLELTDAVRILRFLFAEGPELPCLASEVGGGPVGLPDTGQSACYGYVAEMGWVKVPCAEAADPGQDGAYVTGCPPEGRFSDNGDGTVTDRCTGFMWQKDTADMNGDGEISFTGDAWAWCSALQYCEDLELAGHDDWRLPNVAELQSIVDYGRFDPAIDPVFGGLSSWYWSSTSYAGYPAGAWPVLFYGGFVNDVVVKDDLSFVRAVRPGT